MLLNWISGLTVHRADPVAHGVADQVVVGVKHHKDLVHAELLGGQLRPDGRVVLAALEGDRLTPLVASGLDGAAGRGDGVVAVGGGSDHWGRRINTSTSSMKYYYNNTALFHYLRVLTVSVVLVDLLVRADLDRGSRQDGGQTSLQLGAHHQVVVLVDSFKLLLDAQTLVTGLEDDFSLPGKLAACRKIDDKR